MPSEFKSEMQKLLFDEISKAGELVFACGPKGITANLVGEFHVRHYPEKKEHLLEMGNGEQHVHIDWQCLTRVEYGSFHDEGVLTFFNQDQLLFKLYRMAGQFSEEIQNMMGNLIEDSMESI